MYYNILKPLLFSLDPEVAHNIIIASCSRLSPTAKVLGRCGDNERYCFNVGTNRWTFPVGLAAGLDKNAQAINFFANLGFGAVEVGTVTPLAQEGNPKPRLFRLIEEKSLRNCMGFNNRGMDDFEKNLKSTKQTTVPIGVNIGKNKLTADGEAFKDYAKLYSKFKDRTDYIVINVSSPNTPGLREHQTKDGLVEILKNLPRKKGEVDLFVKIAPDINPDSVYDIVDCVKEFELTGIIATNTTIMPELGVGGISGDLLYSRSKLIREKVLDAIKDSGDIELIGVGGFSNFSQIKDYWKSGGRAVQIYSAFVYQGPQILIDIERELSKEMNQLQVRNFEEYLSAIKG